MDEVLIFKIIRYTLLAAGLGLSFWFARSSYGKSVLAFIKGSIEEMTTNVTWSKYSELQSSTILVIVASLVFAVFIGLVDLLFKTGMGIIY